MEPQRDPSTGLCVVCGANEPGEMVFKIRPDDRGGPSKFQAYVNSPDETNKKILRDVFSRGDVCFRTGDLLYKDEEGWVFFQVMTILCVKQPNSCTVCETSSKNKFLFVGPHG